VLAFVLAEAAALCIIGGLLGLAVATPLGVGITKATGGNLRGRGGWQGLADSAVAIVLLSLAVGLLPALRAARLTIVDALAGR
jgi:ABC-type antimicrobial peptide transport system permease subunit